MWVSDTVRQDFKTRYDKMSTILTDKLKNYSVRIGIFGSYSRNDYKATSDIDFVVITNDDIPRYLRGDLSCDADELNCDITFVTTDYFEYDTLIMATNLRNDFKDIVKEKIG